MRELTEDDGFAVLPSFDITLLHANAGLGRAAKALRTVFSSTGCLVGRSRPVQLRLTSPRLARLMKPDKFFLLEV